MSSSTRLITWAAKDKSNEASGWQTDAIYAPLARWAIYWSFSVSSLCVTPLLLVLVVGVVLIMLRFLHWRSCVRVRLLGCSSIIPLLNLIGFLGISCSCSLAINLALCNLVCLVIAKALSTKNKVLLVYKLTMPKGLLLYKRQGL